MKVKTKSLLLVTLFFYLYSFGFSHDLQLGTYITNKYPITEMSKLSVSNVGAGGMLEFTMPFFNFIGVNTNVEIESVITKKSNFNNWFDFSVIPGIYGNFNFGEKFNLRPSLSYGVVLHLLNIDGETKLFTDQIIQFALSFRFITKSFGHKGFSFGVTPTYTLATEKNLLVHYFGFRTGFHYKF